jgi:hypothetical protein
MPELLKANDISTNPQQVQVKNCNEISDSSFINESSRVEKMKARIDCLQRLRKRSVMFKQNSVIFSRADQTSFVHNGSAIII